MSIIVGYTMCRDRKKRFFSEKKENFLIFFKKTVKYQCAMSVIN